MTNAYLELKNKHQKELNNFPIGWAFNEEQFNKVTDKLGTNLVRIPAGGFIAADTVADFKSMMNKFDKEEAEAMKDFNYCYQMFDYEAYNIEFNVNYDIKELINQCGLTTKEVKESKILTDALNKALEQYEEYFNPKYF